MKLLVIEDETMLRKAIAKGLRKLGYAVDEAADGDKTIECFEQNSYDLILLDLNLPKIDGIEVLKQIRAQDREVKIIIVSARTSIEERILGLDLGANDYVIKPFDFRELEARIRGLLRRQFVQKDEILVYKDIKMDMNQKSVYFQDKKVELTKKEYGILEYLLLHQNKVVSSEELIEHVWDSEVDLFSNSFKFHMSSLRKKLNVTGQEKDWIKNVRGQGYILSDEI